MELLRKTLGLISEADYHEAKIREMKRVDYLAKPLWSLGMLESISSKMAGITGGSAPAKKLHCHAH